MSQARLSKLWKLTDSLRGLLRFGDNRKRKAREIKMRRLQMDPLEERTLLSLTIGSTDDVLVNPTWQDIRGDVSVAINSSNDVVATWTAADRLTDPVSGEVIGEDLNIYARYLTDEVQIVTIPVETALIGNGTTFKLLYGAAAVDRLSFFTATVPNSYDSTSIMMGSVTLGVNNLSFTFNFSEALTPLQNAANLQEAIRSLGSDYSQVEVVAYSEREFDITWYGSKFTGTVPGLAVTAQDFPYDAEEPNVNFVAGAIVETISSPTEITGYSLYSGKDTGIAITNNAQTIAASIEKAFNSKLSDSYYAPVQRNWHYDQSAKLYTYTSNYNSPFCANTEYPYSINRVMPQIEVNVQALETVTKDIALDLYDAAGNYTGQQTKNITYYQFQITFTGNSGYQDHQELVLSSVKVQGNERVNDISFAACIDALGPEGYVETIKESSTVFRVNDPELTVYALDAAGNVMLDTEGYEMIQSDGKTDQYRPKAALDDSGSFIIVWESAADDSLNPYDKTDIYARRFSIQGVIDTRIAGHLPLTFYADGGKSSAAESQYIPLAYSDPYLSDVGTVKLVQGVRPLADQFRVNVEANGTQEKPSITVDSTGNFVISWTTDSQWNDYYAGILARWFDKTGLAITDDLVVKDDRIGTPDYGESYVKMGPDGTTVVVWLQGQNLYKSVYAPGQTTPFVNAVLVAEQAYGPSIDFDANGRYVLAWTNANGSFLSLSNSNSFSTVYAELFYISSTEDEVYSETSLASGPVSNVDTGWNGNEEQASQAEQYLLCVGNVSVGMDADGDVFFAYSGFGFDTQEADTDVYKVDEDGNHTNISNTYTGAVGSDIFLEWSDINSVLTKTGNLDLLPYFAGWFSDASISTYGQSAYADIIYVVDDGVTSVRYMVDVDSYISACLSSVQRQIQADLYEEYYEEYFKELEDYVNARYEVRRQEEGRIRAEIEDVIVNWYHDSLYDKTFDDYANDTNSKVTDIASPWYGMTFAELVSSLMNENSEAYQNMFEKALRKALFDYYFIDRYGMTYEIWYQTLAHDYEGDDLEAKIQEKLAEFDDVIDRDIDLWKARMASTGYGPKAALEAVIADGTLPPVDADAIARQTQIELREWVRQYMIEIEINEVLFRSFDAISMRTLGYTQGWYNDIDTWVQGRYVWGPMIDGLIYNEETEKYEIGPDGIMGIDDLVKEDLTSTYKERYDKIVAQKKAEVAEKLEAVRTYDFYANSDNTVIYDDGTLESRVDDLYSDICTEFYNDEKAKIPVPGDGDYDEQYDIIKAEVEEEYDYQALYERYLLSLQPLYTVNAVVDKEALKAAAKTAAEKEIQDVIDSRMAKWVLEQYVLEILKADVEDEYGETILEFLRTLPDTDATIFTAKRATETDYLALMSMNPIEALKQIQGATITSGAPFYTLRSLYRWYLLNNDETRDSYVDSDGFINEIRLDRAVQLTPVLRIIKELSDAWTEQLAREGIDEIILAAIRTQVREEYYGTKDVDGNVDYSGILYDVITYQYERLSYDCLTIEQMTSMANIFADFLREHPNGLIVDRYGNIVESKLLAYIDEMLLTPVATAEKLRALYTNYLTNNPDAGILDDDGEIDPELLEERVNAFLPLPVATEEELRADYEMFLRLYALDYPELIDEYGNMDEAALQNKIDADIAAGTVIATMQTKVVDLLVDDEMERAVYNEVFRSWNKGDQAVEGERYYDVLYNYYKPIVTHAMYDDLVASYTPADWENLQELYKEYLIEQDLKKPEDEREFIYYEDEINPFTGEVEEMVYINEDALKMAASLRAFDSLAAWRYTLLLTVSPEVASRTASKTDAAIDAVSEQILSWRDRGDAAPAEYYDELTEWVVEEQIRQRMIAEIEVNDEICREYYADDLEKALTELHEENVDTEDRRTKLFKQYYEYVRSNNETALKRMNLADIKSLLTDLTYLPDYYTEYFTAKKDIELESLYADLLAPMYTDSVGNVDDQALQAAVEAVASSDNGRETMIAALVFDWISGDTAYYVWETLGETFQFEQEHYGDYAYDGGVYKYDGLIEALTAHCEEQYYTPYQSMSVDELRPLYRELMVSRYNDKAKLDEAVDNAETPTMVEALAKASIEAEYRKVIAPEYTNAAGVLNVVDIQWAVDHATFDEMAEQIAEAHADLATINAVKEKIETVSAALSYQAIIQMTPSAERIDAEALYTRMVENATYNSMVLAVDSEIRQAHEIDYFNQLRPGVEEEYTQAFTQELLPSYRSETGQIDWWSLELAVQKRIDAQTQIEVDAKIRAEAIAVVDERIESGKLAKLVLDRTSSTISLIDLSDPTGATYDELTINYKDIKCTAQPIAITVTNDQMALAAWRFVEDEIARLVEIRVHYDLYVWNNLETETKKTEFVNEKLNNFLEVADADAQLRQAASERLTNLFNYTDDPTHIATQESIVYDEVFSALYQGNYDSLYTALGANITYCNLINDTETKFVANEFSPFYGMTYAEICDYLTGTLSADANMATHTAIAAAFEAYFEPLVRESQSMADYEEFLWAKYRGQWRDIFEAKLGELREDLSDELYAAYYAKVQAAMENYSENHASEKMQYLADLALDEKYETLLESSFNGEQKTAIREMLDSWDTLPKQLFMADSLASESFKEGFAKLVALNFEDFKTEEEWIELLAKYKALLNAAGYTTSDLNAAMAEINSMIDVGGTTRTEALYIMAEAFASESVFNGFNGRQYLASLKPLVQLMAEYEDLLVNAGYDEDNVQKLMKLITDEIEGGNEAVARRMMASELTQSRFMSRMRNLIAEEANLTEAYKSGLVSIVETIYELLDGGKTEAEILGDYDNLVIAAAKTDYPKLADAIDTVNGVMTGDDRSELIRSVEEKVYDQLATQFIDSMYEIIGYDQPLAQNLAAATGLTEYRCQINLQVIVSSLVKRAEELRADGMNDIAIRALLLLEKNWIVDDDDRSGLCDNVLAQNSDICDSLAAVYKNLTEPDRENLVDLAIDNKRTAADKAQMDLWDLYRPIIEAALPTSSPIHDRLLMEHLDDEVEAHLGEKLETVTLSLVATTAEDSAAELAHREMIADVQRAIAQTFENFFKETYRSELTEKNLAKYETLLTEMGDAFAEKADEYSEWIASYSGTELVDTLTFEEYYPGFVKTKYGYYQTDAETLKAEYTALLEDAGYIASDVAARLAAIDALIKSGDTAHARNIMADALAKEESVSEFAATQYTEYLNILLKQYLEMLDENGCDVVVAKAAVEELINWCYEKGFQDSKVLAYQIMADALANEKVYPGFTAAKQIYLDKGYDTLLDEYTDRLVESGYSETDLDKAVQTIEALADSTELVYGRYDACMLMADALRLDDVAVSAYVDSDGEAQTRSYLEARYANMNKLALAYTELLANAGWSDAEIKAQMLELGSMANQEQAEEIMADALTLESFSFGANGLMRTYATTTLARLKTLYTQMLSDAGYTESEQAAEMARINAMSESNARRTMADALVKDKVAKTYMTTYHGYCTEGAVDYDALYSKYELALVSAGYSSVDCASALAVVSAMSSDDAVRWMADRLSLFTLLSTPKYAKGYATVGYEYLKSNRNELLSRYMTILSNAGYAVSERLAAKHMIESLIARGNENLALEIMANAVTANDCNVNITTRSYDYYASDYNNLRMQYQELLKKSGYFTDDLNKAMDKIDLLVRSGKKEAARQIMANALTEEFYDDGFGATYYDNQRTDEQALRNAYVEKELFQNWDEIVETLSIDAQMFANRFTVDDQAELIQTVVEGRQKIYAEMVAALEELWRPILRDAICDGLIEGTLDARLEEKIAELVETDAFKEEYEERFRSLLSETEILVEMINFDSVEYGKRQLRKWAWKKFRVRETFDETVERLASKPFNAPVEETADAMTELALRAKAKLLTDEEIERLVHNDLEGKIAETVKELVDEKMAEYDRLVSAYYSSTNDAQLVIQAQIDELLAPVAEYLDAEYGGVGNLVADSVPALRETVKEYMLQYIIVPNAVHSREYIYVDSVSKDMTMEELEKMASLVCYADIFREVYEAKKDAIIEKITLDVYANLSDAERVLLERKYEKTAFDNVYNIVYADYHDIVKEKVEADEAETIEKLKAAANDPQQWWAVRKSLDRAAIYQDYWDALEAEWIATGMPALLGLTVGSAAWNAAITEAVEEKLAVKGRVNQEDIATDHPNWNEYWNQSMGLYDYGSPRRGLEILYCEAADAKASKQADDYVESRVKAILTDAINTVNAGGAAPDWVTEEDSIPLVSDELELLIRIDVQERAIAWAEAIVAESPEMKEAVDEAYAEKIEEIKKEMMSADPKYQAFESFRLGRANAVLEYVLRGFRGSANDILYTLFNSNYAAVTGDARGVVNAQRDGNNTKYYLAVPQQNIGSGTLVFEIGVEGSKVKKGVENNHFEHTTISVSLVIEDSKLKVAETAKAITDAFIGSGLNINAGWFDGLSVRVIDDMERDIASLYKGTYWEWSDAITSKMTDSGYWPDQYSVFELTFQGGAHDSNVDMKLLEASTLTFDAGETFATIVSEISGDDGLRQDVYRSLLAIYDSNNPVVSFESFSKLSTVSGAPTLSAFLNEMIVAEGDSEEIRAVKNKVNSQLSKILVRAIKTRGLNTCKGSLTELIDSKTVNPIDTPNIYAFITYMLNNAKEGETLTDEKPSVFVAAFNLFSLNGSVYQLDYDKDATPENEGQFRKLPYTDQDHSQEVITYVDDEGKEHTRTLKERKALSFETRLEDLSTAIDERGESVNEDNLWKEYVLDKVYTGYRGTPQENPSVGMTDSGNIVVAWQQQSRYSGSKITYIPIENVDLELSQSTQIYLRSMIETTDYAGGRVTSVSLPDGNKIENGETITTAVKNLVVSFTENLRTVAGGYAALHSVDNVDNWSLICDGVVVENAIQSINFRMSASRAYARSSADIRINGTDGNPESLAYGSNLWEAVITFKDGYELTGGNYTLVASNKIQDIAGNAINSNGYGYTATNRGNRDGAKFEISFNVLAYNKPLAFGQYTTDEFNEKFGAYYSAQNYIQDQNIGDNRSQYTTEELLEETTGYNANTPNTVASDAGGNFVAVWTEAEKDENGTIVSGGIYYKVYRQEYIYNESGDRIRKTIELSSGTAVTFMYKAVEGKYYYDCFDEGIDASKFEAPQQASVAIDDTGRFVIVWDMISSDEITGAYSRDVYVRRYSFQTSDERDTVTGLPNAVDIGVNGFTGPYRVNVETQYAQQNASVEMDSDGDFVVVWESWEQDGNGWGIYGRRFDDQGDSFGRSNTIQRINFSGEYSVNGNYMDMIFTDLDGTRHTISKVPVYSITSDTAKSIEKSLLNYQENGNYLFQDSETGEKYVTVAVQGAGSIGIEFTGPLFERQTIDSLVINLYDAATGNRSSTLTVTVTTTAYGSQGTEFRVNDTTESHQRFASIGMNAEGTFVVSWTSWGQSGDDPEESNIYMKSYVSNHSLRSTVTVKDTAKVFPQIITTDSPANHQEIDNASYNGVGYISVGSGEWAGTGALLSSGIHVLTAAHVVTTAGGTTVDPTSVSVTFVNNQGEAFTYVAREIYAYSDYEGKVAEDTDLAVILLASVDGVDSSINTYDIYRDSNEIGQSFTMVGFGDFDTGHYRDTTVYTRPTGVKHSGMNTFDMLGTNISSAYNSNTLMFDFDNGTWTYDTFGRNYGVSHYGLGDSEALSAPGDSGGPCFIDGKIAGVISWGSSTYPLFGDYAAAVRVSAYTDWIDGILAGASGSEVLVNRNYEAGMQLWSDVEIDLDGHIAVTWTSYNQDEHGDTASGGTSNGLGGVYVRRYWNDPGTTNFKFSDVELVNDYTGYDQIHSKIDMDGMGNFVVTWESFEDRTYTSDQPVSIGVYAKRYLNTGDYYEYLLTQFGTDEEETETPDTPETPDSPDTPGGVVVTPVAVETTVTVEENLNALSTGAFSKIPSWMTGTFVNDYYGNVYIQDGSIGSEFRVNELTSCDSKRDWLDDQRGVGVTLDDNGDMVFVWTDMNNRSTPELYDARVTYRVISLTEDDVPPFVTSVTAAYGKNTADDFKNASLMGETKKFDASEGPEALVYTFNELMFTTEFVKQLFADSELDGDDYLNSPHITTIYDSSDSTLRSLLNKMNWTLLKDGVPVTSSLISRIYYGYNAGSGDQALGGNFVDYTDGQSNQYELVIEFYEPLGVGYYKLTLSDNVTDLGNNKLDGNYDGKAGASFTIDFIVGEEISPVVDTDVLPYESIDPEIVYFDDGTFIIVAQGIVPPVTTNTNTGGGTGTGDTGDTDTGDTNTGAADTGDTTGDADGNEEEVTYDIIYRKFDSSGNQITQGSVMTANAYLLGDQINPDVDGSGADNYGIVWTGEGEDGQAVYARFYVDGLTTPREIRVNDLFLDTSVTNKIVTDAQIVYLDDEAHTGTYLVTWRQRVDFNYVVMGKLFKVGTSSNSNTVGVTSIGEQFVIAYHERYRNSKSIQTSQSIGNYHVSYGGSAENGYYFGVTWEEYSTSTGSLDVFYNLFTYEDIMVNGLQPTGTVLSNNYTNVKYHTISNVNEAYLVSQTTFQRQCDARGDVNENGDFYVVYMSDQNIMTTMSDIYTRSFTRSGTGRDSVWTPRGGERRVNTETDPNVLVTKQLEPSITATLMTDEDGNVVLDGAGNAVGGYVITWTSFNAEGYNYDLDKRKNDTSYGIKACAYSLGSTSADDKMLAYHKATASWTGAVTTNPDEAIFLVNDYTNGNQTNSVSAIGGWSRITNAKNTVLVPRLVVAWDGVFRDYGTTDPDAANDTGTTTTGTTGTTPAAGTREFTEVPAVFYKWFMVGTKTLYSAQTGDYYDDPAFYSKNSQSNQNRESESGSGSAGYFRPSGTSIRSELALTDGRSSSDEITVILGTNGDDLFEFYVSSDGQSWTAKCNGVKVALPSESVKLHLIGLAGSDTLKFIGSSGTETVVVSGQLSQASIIGGRFELYAFGIADFVLNGGAGCDTLTVNTSNGNDTVTLGLGALTVTSTSRFAVSADGFEEIIAKSSVGTDKAVMLDTKQNDLLTVSSRTVRMQGGGYSNTATGFSSVSSVSSNTGDRAEMSDLTAFNAVGRYVIAATGFMNVTTSAYSEVAATGTGNAAASIIGSRGDDEFISDSKSATFRYDGGIEVNMTGFNSVSVNGNGGNDVATLLTGIGQNVFTGRYGSASLSNGIYTRTLNGFSHVEVERGLASKSAVCRAVFYDSIGSDTLEADAEGATLSIEGKEFYQVMAFDQVITKKEQYSGKDTIKTKGVIDYVIENNGWDILR